MIVARRLLINGRVQGVGYRQAMLEQALRLGLRGWVRNRSDGRVEAVAVGEPQIVDALIRWARHGPPAARVADVGISDADTADESTATTFVWRPTA